MQNRRRSSPILILAAAGCLCVGGAFAFWRYKNPPHAIQIVTTDTPRIPDPQLTPFQRSLLTSLHTQVASNIRYHDGYFQGGDPPKDIGVCTDVVIRAFRTAGVDIRGNVAKDVRSHRFEYAIKKPDANIDHRRCRNLARYFQRYAQTLPTQGANSAWQPGDIVFWDTDRMGKATHVGMVANGIDAEGNPTVVQHWPGMLVRETDGINRWPIVYHFRWKP